MSSTILELKEIGPDGEKVNKDFQVGECNVTLKNPQTINAGDIVNIKSGFLDTVQSGSGKIKITPEESTQFSIDYYLYQNNVKSKGKIFNKVDPESPIKEIDTPFADNKSYILSDSVGTPANPDNVEFFEFTFHRRAGTGLNLTMGGGIVKFDYIDINNAKAVANIKVPKVDISEPGSSSTIKVTDQVLIGKKGSMKLKTSASDLRLKLKLKANEIGIDDRPHTHAAVTVTPHTFTYPFTIPPGDYLPTELAAVITDTLSDINNNQDGAYVTGNSIHNVFTLSTASFAVNTNTIAGDLPYLVASDGGSTVQYPTTIKFPDGSGHYLPEYKDGDTHEDFNIGTTQIGLEFDPSVNKMFFSQIHQNIYNSNGDIIVKPLESSITKDSAPLNQYSWASSAGGFLMTDLQPTSVWFDKMGFLDTDILVTQTQLPSQNLGPSLSNITTTQITNFSPGKTHTEAYVGADAGVLKGSDYDVTQPMGNLLNGSTSVLNRSIYAEQSLNAPIATQGYLLVEVNGLPSKRLIGKDDESTSVTAIVSRFFTNEGYTAFQGDQAIAYEHSGAPFKINNLGFRVLDPDHQLSQFVDDDNTVFIEIIRKAPVPAIADNL